MYLILVIIISVFLTACNYERGGSHKNVEKKEKAPDTLIKVSDGIDELFASVDSIAEIMELSETEYQAQQSQTQKGKQGDQNQGQSGNGNGGGGNESGQGQKNQGGQNGQQQQQQDIKTKDEEIFLKWKEVDKNLEEIHKSWNSYEVESLEKGSNREKGDEFKGNLNDLTVAVENRDMKNIMDSGSKAINSLAVFFDLYKHEIRGDLSRIKYSVYQAFLQAQNGDNDAANKHLDETEEITARIRQRLEEDKTKNLDKLSLSISDMKLALQKNSIELLKIKRDIVIENVKTLQK